MVANLAYNLTDLTYGEILKNNAALSKTVAGKEFRVHILANITINPIKEILDFAIRKIGLKPVVTFGDYDNIIQESFTIGESDVIIIFLELINFSDHFHLHAELLDAPQLTALIEKSKSDLDLLFQNLAAKPLVIFNKFSALPFTGSIHANRHLDRLEQELNDHVSQHKPHNFQVIDLHRIISTVGVQETYDQKKFIKYKSLYRLEFLKSYVAAIENLLLKKAGKLKKAFIFDCDNTLWKGVIGEDGPEGIDMSAASETGIYFNLVQKTAAWLSKKGILICLCSKNNLAEVEDLLNNHPDMVLRHQHLVAMKVNWHNKDENLKNLAEELNIGLDSFVFVDDSDFEADLIKNSLPEVLTIPVPKDLREYPALILDIAQRYFNLDPLQEDLSKVKIYKEQALRAETKKSLGDIDAYLATLGTKAKVSKNNSTQVARIAQLTQKTNQFNLTTKRYTETEIQNFIDSPDNRVFAIDVCDKFGASGLTGVAILKVIDQQAGIIEIDSFLLSCRILGRRIESAFLGYLLDYCKREGFKTVLARYARTNKNSQVKDFYAHHQFMEIKGPEEEMLYQLELDHYPPVRIDFVALSEDE